MLITCQAGFETLLERELRELHAQSILEKGPGWARLDPGAGGDAAEFRATLADASLAHPAFPHLTMLEPVEVRGESVNALATRIADHHLASLRDEKVGGNWPSIWLGPAELVGLGRRITAVERAYAELLKKKLSRVARLAVPDLPRTFSLQPQRGLFVDFVDFGRALVAREAVAHGQRRMADDPLAPSRSFLKIEEAYGVLGREPAAGESVCDLGAAPGGWSYSAAKRGARVTAVDNGPLKAGAEDHPLIEHRREDAFAVVPAATSGSPRFDWLFCDLVEEPHHVMRNIVEPWLGGRACRYFIINLKFGRVDPIALLRELRAANSPFVAHAEFTRVRHLYHDREEFTVVGRVRE